MEGRGETDDDQGHHDQTHGLLGVIGPMAERKGDGGEDLHSVEEIFCFGGCISGKIECHFEKEGAEEKAQNGGEKEHENDIEETLPQDFIRSIGDQHSAHHSSYEGMRGAGRKTPEPRDQVPGDGADESGDNEGDGDVEKSCIKGRDIDDILPDRLGDSSSEEEGADELTNSSHSQTHPRSHCSRGDDGGHDIGGIVKSVREAEDECQDDGDDSKGGWTFDDNLLFDLRQRGPQGPIKLTTCVDSL